MLTPTAEVEAVARISESLAAVRQDLGRRRATGA